MANGPELLGAFSDPTRQVLLNLLRESPCTVGELAGRMPVSRPAVSQHLQVRKAVGLVEEERRGTRHYFRLNPRTLAELRAHIDAMWRDALTTFTRFAEKEVEDGRGKGKTRTHSTKRARRLSH